ncbi:MAG: FCD domain-containing protein, partial [Proteobacteria bacterium]|nr:FCD domain-containing protein [Pseudomonadota bacterium]
EALRVLEEKGLVEIRPGASGGAFVRHTTTDKLTENLNLLMQLDHVNFDHMAEFRETIEAQATRMAAERATPTDIDRLRAIVTHATEVLRRDPNDWAGLCRADINLHVALAEIAANPVFLAVIRMIHQTILGDVDRFALRGKRHLAQNLTDMGTLVHAVAQGDVDMAEELAREHVSTFNAHMKQRNS